MLVKNRMSTRLLHDQIAETQELKRKKDVINFYINIYFEY